MNTATKRISDYREYDNIELELRNLLRPNDLVEIRWSNMGEMFLVGFERPEDQTAIIELINEIPYHNGEVRQYLNDMSAVFIVFDWEQFEQDEYDDFVSN